MSTPKPSEEIEFETPLAMTIIVSFSRLTRPKARLTLEVFPGKRVVLELSLVCSLQSVFNPQSAFYSRSDRTADRGLQTVCSPRSAVRSLRFTLTALDRPLKLTFIKPSPKRQKVHYFNSSP